MNQLQVDPIHAFYTAHPYPPPVHDLARVKDAWRDPNRARGEFHLFWPHRPFRGDLDILIAGCGTSQAARHALCWPQARVTGIDVSATSLEQTHKLSRRYGLDNLRIEQAAIEDVAGLGQCFDLIVCTGVLHHLADPEAGLHALRSVLKPGGVIYMMVYAPYGRTGIYLLQDYCRRLGIGTSAEDIAGLAQVVAELPPQHPVKAVLGQSRDVLDRDALADALLNPRDRAYSVPQLFEALAATGLVFKRWYRQAPYLPECGAIARTTHAARIGRMAPVERYAAMELWRGAMTTHSVVAGRDDDEADDAVDFDLSGWQTYVPIRLPSTRCVDEQLPPGMAGLLFNRNHRFHDLILPVDAQARRMVEAIDGRRSIGEIAELTAGAVSGEVKALFRALWAYDQIVFDGSRIPLD